MNRKNYFFLLLFFLLSSAAAFATGAQEARLYYLPRNVVNNGNVIIDLTDSTRQEQLSATDFGITFSNSDAKHLGLFRIEENLTNDNGDQSDSAGVKITIKSLDNWEFVHEINTTSRRKFTLNGFKIQRIRTDHISYFMWVIPTGNDPDFNSIVGNGASPINLSISQSEADSLEFYVEYTPFDAPVISKFCKYIYEYDIATVLLQDNRYLEPGYYSTRLEVTVSRYKIHDVDGSSMKSTGDVDSITYYITLRGHVGDYDDNNANYTFLVTSTADTYGMNLEKTVDETSSSPFEIARVQFLYATSNQSSQTANHDNKFKIFISPTSSYRQTFASGLNPYYFYKSGTEYVARDDTNTVYYSLCASNGSGLSVATETKNNRETTISDTTYQLVASYDKGYNETTKKYNETWTIDTNIYLKLTKDATHDPGTYFSYIYFTLVVN